jgi:hypothetical protein
MDPDDVTPDMRSEAEIDHGDYRQVGDDWIYFDERTDKPFPWYEKAYKKAKKAAREAKEEAKEADASEPPATATPCE